MLTLPHPNDFSGEIYIVPLRIGSPWGEHKTYEDSLTYWRACARTINGGQPIRNAKGQIGTPSFGCALLIWK